MLSTIKKRGGSLVCGACISAYHQQLVCYYGINIRDKIIPLPSLFLCSFSDDGGAGLLEITS